MAESEASPSLLPLLPLPVPPSLAELLLSYENHPIRIFSHQCDEAAEQCKKKKQKTNDDGTTPNDQLAENGNEIVQCFIGQLLSFSNCISPNPLKYTDCTCFNAARVDVQSCSFLYATLPQNMKADCPKTLQSSCGLNKLKIADPWLLMLIAKWNLLEKMEQNWLYVKMPFIICWVFSGDTGLHYPMKLRKIFYTKGLINYKEELERGFKEWTLPTMLPMLS